jgi:arginyl-tRNA--protein-N-Asp/Glu arginylyltransferase
MPQDDALIVIKPPKKALFLGGLLVQKGTCPYYPDKRPTTTAFTLPRPLSAPQYQIAMDMGMRRSGTLVYRPLCEGCRKCLTIRIRVADFTLSHSQRRIMKKCESLFGYTSAPPSFSPEKLELYERYVREQHGHTHDKFHDEESYRRFLVESNVDTLELTWRDRHERIVAVGIVDLTPLSLSSVYFFWDPDLKEFSLGIYSILKEIELCKLIQVPYYYLGYLVPGVHTMDYKGNFAASEVWDGQSWCAIPSRDMADAEVERLFDEAEQGAAKMDGENFDLEHAIEVKLES